MSKEEARKAGGQSQKQSAEEDDQLDDEDIAISFLDESDLSALPRGSFKGFYVVKQYKLPSKPFDLNRIKSFLAASHVERLKLTPQDIALPIALMLADLDDFQSISRARKVCRKGNVLIHRGPLQVDKETGESTVFDPERCERGKVGCRVYPGDVLGKQVRMGNGRCPTVGHKAPPFDLPIVVEDDYVAIVNKPVGVVVNPSPKEGHGIMTIRSALPFTLKPSQNGTFDTLSKATPVHRLDKPTCGLLIVAKTKPAMRNLISQFQERIVKKQYTAIVSGIPPEPAEKSISSKQAFELGVDIDPDDSTARWQVCDTDQEGKRAVTVWRSLSKASCVKANNKTVTMVELKPKTGRTHQLRRHMAWDCETPIVGDKEYDKDGHDLREHGLFLCSNKVTLQHPYYNTEKGREIYNKLSEEERTKIGGKMWLSTDDDKVMISASIELPGKFATRMKEENAATTLS